MAAEPSTPPRPLRSVRVPTPGLRARFADQEGDLVNMSVSGALVRLPREVRAGTTAPVVLDLDARRIRLEARVVRSVPVAADRDPSARPIFAVGIVFLDPASAASKAVVELCGGRVALEELAYGILFLAEETALNQLIERTLRDAGYSIHVVRDPRQALGSARETQSDLLIIDLKQNKESAAWWVLDAVGTDPAMEGKSLLALVEATSLTADRRHQLAEQRVRLLLFPFTPEELLAAVERALRESV
jgi:CheY-like chemotaxis protein